MQIRKNSAFTIMEIMVVLGIIIFLMSMLIPRVTKYFGKSDVKMTKIKMTTLKEALVQYKMDVGHYPRTKEGGLNALIDESVGSKIKKWRGPYAQEDELYDKWDNEFIYNSPPQEYDKDYRSFEIISYGANGEEGGTGDDHDIVDGQ